MDRSRHILNAATNLLGISLLIVAGLHLANTAGSTLADEIAWVAALCFSASCCLSYLSIRSIRNEDRLENAADKTFLIGVFTLLASVAVLAFTRI